jgi:hypothetical protein
LRLTQEIVKRDAMINLLGREIDNKGHQVNMGQS